MSNMYKEVLQNLGYKLIDCGDHWRTNAVYRDGDNQTALQIYKNTGVWTDYIKSEGYRPLKNLIELTLKGRPGEIKSILKSLDEKPDNLTEYKTKSLIEMEKTYDEKILDKLFPNYNFYNNKGISEDTQNLFKVGLAGAGNMYRRMVFPIYNEHKQIIGFSGRRVDDNDYAKWKHIGQKRNWIFPAYTPNKENVDSIITKEKSVYLVESIGDAMSLFDNGIKNVLVIFGLSVSASIISYLSSKSLENIYIAGNNDFESKENRGLKGSIKNYLKLSSYFDLDIMSIKNPPKGFNDLGDAHAAGEDLKAWSRQDLDKQKQKKYISDFILKNREGFSKAFLKKAKQLNE